MNINDSNKYDLIDKYLGGGMSQNEVDSFKAFLQSDSDMAIDLNIVSEIDQASTFAPIENTLRDTLSDIRNTAVNTDTAVRNNSYLLKSMAILAATTLLLLLLFKVMNPLTNSDTSVDYQQIAMVEPLELTTKSAATGFDIRSMQDLYNEGRYAEAIPHLNGYLEQKPNDLDVLLAKGIALTETNDLAAAHKVFDEIKALGPRVKKYLWFDALVYSKEGNTAAAKTLLHDIVTSKGYNYEQAKELLESIK